MKSAWLLLLLATPTLAQDDPFASRLDPAELARRVFAAAASPLGSKDNPVRAELPTGQRAYLARLRCADGSAPAFKRFGNLGPGIYDTIVDHYDVDCGTAAPGKVVVIMDMYHPGHVEVAAVPGFAIVPPPTGLQ